MTHAHAPLTPTGRLRMVQRHLNDGIPQAHVAAEFRVARPTVATWVARYRAEGEAGLLDRPSRPRRSPAQLDPEVVAQIQTLRQQPAQRITARGPGHMVHLEVKKIGRIPGGGGWRAHGRDCENARAAKRGPGRRVGCTSLHSAIDGFTGLAYTEALEDERTVTTIGFFCRARAFFAAHGTRIDRVVTDNFEQLPGRGVHPEGGLARGRHHRIRPYTPRHDGKVERCNRLMVDEVLYARPYTSETARREALQVWVNHDNYHRPHT